ncbi:MAG: DUF4384 domain-containing protein [Muribaculaceae bacterium]|nr:DUF4384 domain-containing protein [Muribaculaceae bacterium]
MAKNTDKIVLTILILYLLLLFQQEVFATLHNSLIKVTGEYTYLAPPTVGEEEAKVTALKRAKLQAIEDKFGSTLHQNNSTTISVDNTDSNVSFLSLTESEIKGEWVETIGKPEYKVSYDNGLVVYVKVKGYISPVKQNQTDLDIKILCNGTSDKFVRKDFHNGDDIFIKFTSPIDGFIAVYISDGNDVYCLLPYPDDSGIASPVKSGVTRILFSYDHNDLNESVKQYHLTCDSNIETNFLYILFSPNEFSKAVDRETGRLLPRQLPFSQFYKWMTSCKRRDNKFEVKEYTLTIIP